MTRNIAAFNSTERLTLTERIARVAVGAGLLSTMVAADGALGWAAVLPLLAVYPVLTGVMGYEPLRAFLPRDSIAYRTAQLTAGGAMVGSIFVTSQFALPDAFAIVPLIGVYYVLAGILGRAPLATVDESLRYEAFADEAPVIPATVTVATRRATAEAIRRSRAA